MGTPQTILKKWLESIIECIKSFLSLRHERTAKAIQNIFLLFIIKGGSVLINLLVVPLTIDYVDPTRYGIWLTLNSLITWVAFFDLGLGSGLRNKLTEAITNSDDYLAKTYVSTAYFILTIISVFLILIFLISNNYIDWAKILNVSASLGKEMSLVTMVIFPFFAIQFILQLFNIVCLAKQNAMITGLVTFASSLLSLLVIFTLTKTTTGSLKYLCYAMGASPLLVMLIFSIALYTTSYKKYRPSFKYVKLVYAKDLFQLGIKFFLINIGVLFFYFSANIIISQLLGPEAVTPYNIAFKYFSVISIISSIVMTPFWVAFNEANLKQDFEWIKKTTSRLQILCVGFFLMSVLMLLMSSHVYDIWIGTKVVIPFSLSAVIAVYVVINTYRSIFNSYVNGIGKIQLQLLLVISSGLINIPLSIFLGKILGVTGIILSTTILCAFCAILEVIQYRKLINNNAFGIWNK